MKLNGPRVYARFFGADALSSHTFVNWPLTKILEDSGVKFTTLLDAEEVWLFDLDPWFVCSNLARIKARKTTLIVFEPQAVHPLQHSKWLRRIFDRVIVFNPEMSSEGSRLVLYSSHPSFMDGRIAIPAMRTDLRIAVAAGDKQSASKTSLYKLRRQSILALLEMSESVSLAGPGWEKPMPTRIKQALHSMIRTVLAGQKPRLTSLSLVSFLEKTRQYPRFSFYGWVESEVRFFSQHQIVLVIENDIPFHSEKIFAAIASGSKVVYVGPSRAWLRSLPQVFFAKPSVKSIVASVHDAKTSLSLPVDLERFCAHHSLLDFYMMLTSELKA